MSSRMATIEFFLDRYLKRCGKFKQILAGTPSEAQLEEIRRDLSRMHSHLTNAVKVARRDGAFTEMTRANAIDRNQQERYRSFQSISNIRGNVNRLNRKAEELKLKLYALAADMGNINLVAAIAQAISKQTEEYTVALAKGEKHERDAIDVADHLGGTIVIIVALAKLLIELLLSRTEKDKDQPQG